jgi:subtilisin family serine protease
MNMMQGSMQGATNRPVYWRKNRVTLTLFPDDVSVNDSTQIEVEANKNVTDFNNQVLKGMPPEELELLNWYAYSAPDRSTHAGPAANIAVFCNIRQKPGESPATSGDMGSDGEDRTLQVINYLNEHARERNEKTRFHAMPIWLCSNVPDQTHGCPVTPPFPVPVGKMGNTGQWKTILPQLPSLLQDATGAGVTVFILDTFPKPDRIKEAATAAGSQNTLLQHMAKDMMSERPYRAEPPAIGLNYTYEIPGPEDTAVTGKDIYGRLTGFPMPDHGLFIAGLVRDLAREASIECIRVLNDFGVGDAHTLYQALTAIEERLRTGDLQGKPVVINLSLVIGPPECDTDPQMDLPDLLKGLLKLLQSMASLGAVFVASVGNDSDPRDFCMNPAEIRFNARYPAAFGNDQPGLVIPVGAVNQDGNPAAYSNYPGPNGIATYGGDLPKPDPWLPSAASHAITKVDRTEPIDALRGIYTEVAYPALSRNDRYLAQKQPELSSRWQGHQHYTITSNGAWTYWSGTSFAAPIITALAARVLQSKSGQFLGENAGENGRKAVLKDITDASDSTVTWTGLENDAKPTGPMITATQEWQHSASERNAQEPY